MEGYDTETMEKNLFQSFSSGDIILEKLIEQRGTFYAFMA